MTVEYSHNSIVIRGVDLKSDSFTSFNKYYSVWNQITFSYEKQVFSIANGNIYIPRSVGLQKISKFFPTAQQIENMNMCSRSRNISYKMTNQPISDIQKMSIKFLTDITIKSTDRERALSLNTGDGKTFSTIYAISNIRKVPMIIVNSTDLATQWKNEYLKHTDILEDDVVILSGQDSVDKARSATTKAKVYIAIHHTINNIIKNNHVDLSSVMDDLGVGIRVFDEAHVHFENICRINSFSSVDYTIYLSATLRKTDYIQDVLYGKVFGNITFLNGKRELNDRYHNVYAIEMQTKPDTKQLSTFKTRYGFSGSAWADFLLNSRYEFISNMIKDIIDKTTLKNKDKPMKTAIILPSIEMTNWLKEDLAEHYKMEIGTFIGEVKKKDRAAQLEKTIFLSNTKIFDKGVDVPDLECMIVLTSVNSDVQLEQLIGRIRYKEGKRHLFIDIRDSSVDSLKYHYNSRKKFYKKSAKMLIDSKTNYIYKK